MTLEKILEAMIIVPILVMVIIYSVDTITPLYKYNDLKSVCYEYNQMIIKEGTLSQEDITELRKKLENKGLTNITMSLPTAKEWGDSFTILITGEFTSEKRNIDLSKRTVKHEFRYKRTGLSLKGGD